MTKVRPPLTVENALFRVFGAIGVERAAELLELSVPYLYAMSDPDKREQLAIADALKLDLEHHAVTGNGYPLFETYALVVEAAHAERFADAAALNARASAVALECGQATAAIINAARPGATDRDRETAVRETHEAICELTHALPQLQTSARDGATPGPRSQTQQSDTAGLAGGHASQPP